MVRAASTPHTREEHLSFRVIYHLSRTWSLYVLVTKRCPILSLLDVIRSTEILSVHKRIASVLLTAEVPHECKRIVRLVLVGRSLRA